MGHFRVCGRRQLPALAGARRVERYPVPMILKLLDKDTCEVFWNLGSLGRGLGRDSILFVGYVRKAILVVRVVVSHASQARGMQLAQTNVDPLPYVECIRLLKGPRH